MHRSLAAVTALLVSVAFAQSNPPSPSASKSNKRPQSQTAKQDQPAKTDERGTEQSPLFVKVIPAQEDQQKAQTSSTKQDEKPRGNWWPPGEWSPEWAMADFTVLLVFVTTILAIFTGGLWSATVKLAKDARLSSVKQTRHTLKSLRIAKESADAATTAANVAKQQFEYAHRAKVSIIDAQITIDETSSAILASYMCHNSGEIAATNAHTLLLAGDAVPKLEQAMVVIEDAEQNWGFVIAPNEGMRLHRKVSISMPLEEGFDLAIVLSYLDGFNNRRWTWRRYRSAGDNWIESGSEQQ